MRLDFGAVLTTHFVDLLWGGLVRTCAIALAAWLLAFTAGLVLVAIRLAPFQPLRLVVIIYVEFTRNIPLLVQMMFWYFAVPIFLPKAVRAQINAGPSEMILATLALGICVSGYFAEIFRSGVKSVPDIQFEASRAIGFTYLDSMRYVILPQALRHAIPSIMNMTLTLLKGTSIASAIGVLELAAVARNIENETFQTFEVFTVVTIIYLALTSLVGILGYALENTYRIR